MDWSITVGLCRPLMSRRLNALARYGYLEPMPITNTGGKHGNYGESTTQLGYWCFAIRFAGYAWLKALVKWTIAFAFATKESLRSGKNFTPLNDVLTEQELEELKSVLHLPLFVASKIAALLQKARSGYPNTNGLELDGFEFSLLEGQRILLIDYLDKADPKIQAVV